MVEDRRGVISQFPFVSIAVGMVSDEGNKFSNLGQINHSLTQLKKYAKSFQGSAFVRDRRTLTSQIAEFTWGPGSTETSSSKVLDQIASALGSFLPGQLSDIIRAQSIIALFQPIIDMKSDDVVGHEALIRGPAGSPLEFPDALFQTARGSNQVLELDILCMKKILALSHELHRGMKLFVNIFPETLLEENVLTREILNDPRLKQLEVVFALAGSNRASDPVDLFHRLSDFKRSGFQSLHRRKRGVARTRHPFATGAQARLHQAEHDELQQHGQRLSEANGIFQNGAHAQAGWFRSDLHESGIALGQLPGAEGRRAARPRIFALSARPSQLPKLAAGK